MDFDGNNGAEEEGVRSWSLWGESEQLKKSAEKRKTVFRGEEKGKPVPVHWFVLFLVNHLNVISIVSHYLVISPEIQEQPNLRSCFRTSLFQGIG